MLGLLAAGGGLLASDPSLGRAQTPVLRSSLGIGMHSYGFHWKAAREKPSTAPFSDALDFLEYCHGLGAGGVQVTIASKEPGYAQRIRAKAEAYGMNFEGQLSMPKDDSEAERFEAALRTAKEAGATVVRTAFLSGRRYETFTSAEAFRQFRENSWKSLGVAEPILKRHRMRLAIENHKDWLAHDLVEMLHRLSSEFVGACVDTGNCVALLEDPLEVVEALAPFAFSTHLKDMGVQEYQEGFLLSEVPLGEGFLDLRKMIGVLQKANPAIRFNLEMITRDPLKIPCLTDKYWVTMGDAKAERLARALSAVRKNSSKKALPRTTGKNFDEQLKFEDDNVRECLKYAQTSLGL
jgi:sugar phosphate isomerase/epimerase